MTTATAKKPKSIAPQSDVRIIGGVTTIKLRAPGNHTLERMNALLAELATNAKTHPGVSRVVSVMKDAMVDLSIAVGFSGLPKDDAK